jgi:hypothetical protein
MRNNALLLIIVVLIVAAIIISGIGFPSLFANQPLRLENSVKINESTARINFNSPRPEMPYSNLGIGLYANDLGSESNYSDIASFMWEDGVVHFFDFLRGIDLEVHDSNKDLRVNQGDFILVHHLYGPIPTSFGINAYDNGTSQIITSLIFSMATGSPSITIYEQSGEIAQYSFSVYSLMHGGGYFHTWGWERYEISSDNTNVTIKCFRDAQFNGTRVGNNIVAVRLNGVAGYPDGLWASKIVNYTLGYGGIVESFANALGDANETGYGSSHCTYGGDQYSEMTLAFDVPILTERKQ